MRLIFTILLVVACNSAYTQKEGQGAIDSILAELPRLPDDSNKVDRLTGLTISYLSVDPEKGIMYGQQALELARKLKWKKGIAQAGNALGKNYMRESNNPKALEYYQEALRLYKEIGFKKGVATVTSNIGIVYYSEGDYDKALAYYFDALRVHESIGNRDGIGVASDNIGDIYKTKGNYSKALLYYDTALQMFHETGRKTGMAFVTGDMGIVYRYQKNYAKAITAISQTIKMDEELGDKLGIAWGYTNVGITYLSLYKDTSLETMAIAGSFAPIVGGHPPPVKGKAYILARAVDYLQQGLDKGKKILAPDILQACYQNLADAYKLLGDYKTAMVYFKDYTTIKDSVFSQANTSKIARIEYESARWSDSLKASEEKKIADLKLRHERHYTYLGITGIALLLGFSFFIIKERGKSEKLLLNILPVKVAAEIKSKGIAKTRSFNDVTVLFTDFVNFTRASESMKPQELIDELHACFSAFDEITEQYGVEKIKTIGDAYLAVAGLPVADPKHAEHAIMAAIGISNFMKDRLAKMEYGKHKTFDIRIGVHSGNVVAGIVGEKKFAYDIWGDTVNIASRMEQNCPPGKINISRATYELVKDKFKCSHHGDIGTKSKGTIKMYLVTLPQLE